MSVRAEGESVMSTWLKGGAVGIAGRPQSAPVADLPIRPNFRIRPEGRLYRERSYSGTGVAEALNVLRISGQPIAPLPPPQKRGRERKPSKNFAAQNQSFIRSIQKQAQARLNRSVSSSALHQLGTEDVQRSPNLTEKAANGEQRTNPSPPRFRPQNGGNESSQHVENGVVESLQHNLSPLALSTSPRKGMPSSATEVAGQTSLPRQGPSPPRQPPRRRPVSAGAPQARQHVPGQVQRQRGSSAKNRHSDGMSSSLKKSTSYVNLQEVIRRRESLLNQRPRGVLPAYLTEQKAAREVAAAGKLEAEQLRLSGCPPGHRLMPYDERTRTLASLEAKERDLVRRINTLPVRSDTLMLRRRKAELAAELADVDAAIAILSKPKVFVKDDIEPA